MKSTTSHVAAAPSSSASRLQLACLAASPAGIRAAIDAGADWVRLPYALAHACATPPRDARISQAIRYVHGRGRKIVLDLCFSAQGSRWKSCRDAVEWAATQGFDAILLSDFSLALHCAIHFPALPLHFVACPDVCARTATQLTLQLNAARVLVTPLLSVAQLVEISTKANVEIEILACETSRMSVAEGAPYDCLFPEVVDKPCNDPCFLTNGHLTVLLERLPLLSSLGIRAIQVEPRNDLPNEIARTAGTWRTAIDRCLADRERYAVASCWQR